MKKKETSEVSDLVKKLQKTFLSEPADSKKKNRDGDADDRAFHNKLAALLERLSRPVTPKKDEELESLLSDPDAETADTPMKTEKVSKKKKDTPAEKPSATPKAKKKSPQKVETNLSASEKKAAKKTQHIEPSPEGSPSLPPIQNSVINESGFEESVVAAPVVEELVVAESVVEESVVEEPIVEELVVAESVVEEPILEASIAEEPVMEEHFRHPLDNVVPLEKNVEDREAEIEPTIEDVEETETLPPHAADTVARTDRADSIAQAEVEPVAVNDTTVEIPREEVYNEAQIDQKEPSQSAKSNKTLLQPTVQEGKQAVEPMTASSQPPAPSPSPIADKKPTKGTVHTAKAITIKAPFEKSGGTLPKNDHSDAIVIRPSAGQRIDSEPIVIQPRKADKPAPVPQSAAPKNNSPIIIKIGKESATASNEPVTDRTGETRIPNMKKEKKPLTPTEELPKKPPSISAIKQAAAVSNPAPSNEQAQDAPTESMPAAASAKKTNASPSVSVPRSHTGAKKRAVSKKTVADQATAESDERLEEALEDALIPDDLPEEIPIDEPEEIAPPPQKMTLFQRRQKRREEKEEEKLSTLDLICKRSGLTADDINLIFELGYENELGRLVGYETLKRLKTEHLRQVEKQDTHHYRTAMGYRGEEWTGTHREKVLAAYVHDRKRVLARLILTVLLSALLFFVEMPQLIGAPLLSIADAYPLLLPIVGMLLFVCVALLSLQQIEAGLRSLFHFTPTPYSVIAILPPLILGYDLLKLFARSPMPHANFTASLTFLAVAVCDVLRLACEMRTVRMLSTDEVKQMLSAAPPRKRKLRSGDKIVKIINDDLGENLYQIKPGIRTVGFFRRSNTLSNAARPFSVLLISMLSLAALFGLISSVYTASASVSVSTALLVLLASTPISAIVTYFYPLCRANRLLSKCGSALIGEESVQELEGQKTVIFPDTKLFTAERSTQLSIRAGDDFRTDLRLVSSLLRRLGGTAEQITNGTRPTREDPPISIVRIQDGGVEAMVDHSYHVLLGNAAFLQRGGIAIPKENSDAMLRRPDHVSLMYAAINGVLKFSYEIEYTTDLNFEEQIRNLAEDDTGVAIHTYDPNLNREFVQKCRSEQADPVRVIKPGRYEENRPTELVDAAAVTSGDVSDLIPALHAAKAISRVRRFGLRMQFIGSLLGSAAILLLVFFGKISTVGMLPIAAYQCFWILVSLIASAGEINRKNLHIS